MEEGRPPELTVFWLYSVLDRQSRVKKQDTRLYNSRSTAGCLAEAGTLGERLPLAKMVQKHFAFSLPPTL